MEFEFIAHYFFNEQWNSDLLPNTFLMTNGIRIHYPLLLLYVDDREITMHWLIEY